MHTTPNPQKSSAKAERKRKYKIKIKKSSKVLGLQIGPHSGNVGDSMFSWSHKNKTQLYNAV